MFQTTAQANDQPERALTAGRGATCVQAAMQRQELEHSRALRKVEAEAQLKRLEAEMELKKVGSVGTWDASPRGKGPSF